MKVFRRDSERHREQMGKARKRTPRMGLYRSGKSSIVLPGLVPAPVKRQATGYSLRFYRRSVDDIDRAIDSRTETSQQPAHGHWCCRFPNRVLAAWVSGTNQAGPLSAATTRIGSGSIVLDRDRFSSGRKLGCRSTAQVASSSV